VNRLSRTALVALTLAVGAPTLLVAVDTADAQVVVRPGRGGRSGPVLVRPTPPPPGCAVGVWAVYLGAYAVMPAGCCFTIQGLG